MKSAWSLMLIVALGVSGCGSEDPARSDTARVVKLVDVSTAQQLPSRRFIGRVEARQTVDLSFRVGGQLSELPATPGTVIAQGETIARLDPTDYQLAVRRAEAEHQQATSTLSRQRNLLEQNAVSRSVFEEAETQYRLTEVQLDNARQELSYSVIEAPFDALITRRMVDNHTNVQPNTDIVRVQDVGELRVRINIPEGLIRYIDEPERFDLEAQLVSMPGQRLPLVYREHVTEPDEVAQTYEVALAFRDQDAVIALPGMTASVSVSPREVVEPPGVVVPVSAIAKDSNGDFRVWRYTADDGTVHPQPVVVGEMQDRHIAVLSGLDVGDTIVAAGVHALRDGMRVRPMEEAL
ncbi:RND family efflux transporter, MFP subunit [Franzmannia pantelleriensis]|uniref:RND family efflux transporter, MFP subunit n=1 Tax=Franzmannia pantelleriensis TaxID=48727 RepID=A0A1G9GGD3_9GAMM|nr:efflux RND transporter periplasmic adaptor subunit [Halomonas pantelleriensis]SDK99749.1 RND family efflux transporter, MFP subunit [Halomonas pantelleriensis]